MIDRLKTLFKGEEKNDLEVSRQEKTGGKLSEINADLGHAFVNLRDSVLLLFERGDKLEKLEKKSTLLIDRAELFGSSAPPLPSRCLTFVEFLKRKISSIQKWIWASAFCRALIGDPSMNRPLTLVD